MDSIIFTRIKELCAKRGISISKLELEVGMSQYSITRWRSSNSPTVDKLLRVAQYFHVSLDYLVGKTDVACPSPNVQAACDLTGLSEESVINLTELSQLDDSKDKAKLLAVNLLLEDDAIEEWGSQLLQSIADYLFAPEIPKRKIQFTADEIKIISDDSSQLDDPQSYSEYANVLCDRLLIDRVMRSIEGARYQHRHPEPMGEI